MADFTLGDIWETGRAELDDNKGSTLIHIWSKKGTKFFESIKSHIRYVEYPFDKSRGTERTNTIQQHPDREQLFTDVKELTANAFFAKYAPYTTKVRIKKVGRYLIWRLHLHNAIRHIKHLIIHR